jgi:thioredoxin-dependent peroxiredoxin
MMCRLFIFCALWGTSMTAAAVGVGDRAPNKTLKDQHGTEVVLESLWARGIVVLYFYPKDDTPGCTAEAKGFRDDYEDFLAAGAQVVGVSSDSVDSHRRFAQKYRLPFTLLADPDGGLRRAFAVPSTLGVLAGRVTYVIDTKGVVRMVFNSQLRAKRHIVEALQTVQYLANEAASAAKSRP